jgi:hypothetical protein
VSTTYLELTACDPVVARDGRPFGIGQGFRMKGLPWPVPSVVAGSLRTALVKAAGGDFAGTVPAELPAVAVAGVFPVCGGQLYLPAPTDCVVHPERGPLRVYPQEPDSGGADFPAGGLRPVMLSFADSATDFKPKPPPAWWPADQLAGWLTGEAVAFDGTFLGAAVSQPREHVQLDPDTGAAAESLLFTTAGLTLTHLPRFGAGGGTSPSGSRRSPWRPGPRPASGTRRSSTSCTRWAASAGSSTGRRRTPASCGAARRPSPPPWGRRTECGWCWRRRPCSATAGGRAGSARTSKARRPARRCG